MLAEFALEPSLLNNWDRFQRYTGLFGVSQGRLISRFPKKWQRLVLEAVSCGTIEKARIEEALRRLNDRLFPRHHEWRDDLAWIENAVAEHAKRPFHVILAAMGVPGNDAAVDATDLDVTALPAKVQAGPSRFVIRSAQEMAAAARVLLQFSSKIVLMDRNFAPDKARFRDPLAEMLLHCLDTFGKPRRVEIELHIGDHILASAPDFKASCDAHLQDTIPVGLSITLVRWSKDDLHNRYILTDRGGIQIGEGLDTANPTTSRTDDVLTLIAMPTAAELLERYCGPAGKVKQLLQHRIVGRRDMRR